jgi:hypothetical protein
MSPYINHRHNDHRPERKSWTKDGEPSGDGWPSTSSEDDTSTVSHKLASTNRAVAGLLTVPPIARETYGRRFRRGRETRAEQSMLFLFFATQYDILSVRG